MHYNIKAIPTRYNGTIFRSRLEARWAAFFDLCDWRWDYEPLDLNGWIPDFLIEKKLLVEIKPLVFGEEPFNVELVGDLAKCLVAPTNYEFLILGLMPVQLKSCGAYEAADGTISCIGSICYRVKNDDTGLFDIVKDDALLKLTDTDKIDIGGSYMDWGSRLGKDHNEIIHRAHKIPCVPWTVIERLWREAGNLVQWKKPVL